MLPEGEGLCTIQFGTLFELVQSALARLLVLLGVHPKVVLGVASSGVRMVEGTIAAIEYVHFREREQRIPMDVLLAVLGTHELGPVLR